MITRLVSFFVLFVPVATSAQHPVRSLDYRAPTECPDAGRFADEVSARIGRAAFADGGEIVRVRILRDEGELVGTMEIPDGSTRVYRSAECADLIATIATSLAIELDDRRPAQAEVDVLIGPPVSSDVRHTTDGGRVHVRVTSSQPDLGLHLVGEEQAYGSGGYAVDNDRFCIAPCEGELGRGAYHFAVASGPNEAIPLPGFLRIDADSELVLGYESHSSDRDFGLAWMIGGALGGLALGLTGGVLGLTEQSDALGFGLGLGGGGAIYLACTVVGVVFMRDDVPSVEVRPLAP